MSTNSLRDPGMLTPNLLETLNDASASDPDLSGGASLLTKVETKEQKAGSRGTRVA